MDAGCHCRSFGGPKFAMKCKLVSKLFNNTILLTYQRLSRLTLISQTSRALRRVESPWGNWRLLENMMLWSFVTVRMLSNAASRPLGGANSLLGTYCRAVAMSLKWQLTAQGLRALFTFSDACIASLSGNVVFCLDEMLQLPESLLHDNIIPN